MTEKKIYFENLDALRWLCFLGVFFYHSFHAEHLDITKTFEWNFFKCFLFENSNLGVNVFFVLSGFLITFLLIEEVKQNGKINIGRFWLRRVLRIWPVYYACVFFGFVIFPIFKQIVLGKTGAESANPWAYLFFYGNLDMVYNGLPDSSALGILWSIAIEEQFYVLQPLMLYRLKIKHYWIPWTLIIIASAVFRFQQESMMPLEHHSLSCFNDLCVGSLAAWAWQSFPVFRLWIAKISRKELLLVYALLLYYYFFRFHYFLETYFMAAIERVLFSLLIVYVILEQNFAERSFFKLGKIKIFTALGKITYGLYCYHIIALMIVHNFGRKLDLNLNVPFQFYIKPVIALLLTILMAKISYEYFEKPFLKLKDKFGGAQQKSQL